MSTASKHAKACKDFKKHWVDTHLYPYCEVCFRADLPLDAHHIYYASRFPKHPQLHNFKNMILVCRGCHAKFHGGDYKDIFIKIEKERGLKELFGVS